MFSKRRPYCKLFLHLVKTVENTISVSDFLTFSKRDRGGGIRTSPQVANINRVIHRMQSKRQKRLLNGECHKDEEMKMKEKKTSEEISRTQGFCPLKTQWR